MKRIRQNTGGEKKKTMTLMDLLIRNEDPKGEFKSPPTVKSSRRVRSKKDNDDLESTMITGPMTKKEADEYRKTHKLGVPNG
jgi:hypothetical protein